MNKNMMFGWENKRNSQNRNKMYSLLVENTEAKVRCTMKSGQATYLKRRAKMIENDFFVQNYARA